MRELALIFTTCIMRKMEEIQCDLLIIGSGPSGQKAAIQGAKLGKKVVVVEKHFHPGGACLHSGTIPSKTLREAIVDLTGFHQRVIYGKDFPMKDVTVKDLSYRLAQVVEEERNIISRQFKKNGITYLFGTARFENEHTLLVVDEETHLVNFVHASKIILSTGSKPRNPLDVPFDDDVILDSTRLLSIKKVPDTMIVLGGGIIGSEYASFFSALGTEVTVLDKKDHMLPLLDHEIGIHLQTALTNLGLRFRGNKIPKEIKREGDRAVVITEDGARYEAECLLYALGRVANVDGLHIENAGLSLSGRGYIPVNELFQTAKPHIYAVGDVIGGPCLASTSMEQGRLAARHASGVETRRFPDIYPIGIYTIPTISTCGYTEEELIEKGFHYEVGRAYYYEIARSHIAGSNVGMFKILFHAETLEILGVHVIGRGATEVIHIGQMAMGFHARIDYFVDQVFNYPTYAEGYRIAALNGLNKIKHRK